MAAAEGSMGRGNCGGQTAAVLEAKAAYMDVLVAPQQQLLQPALPLKARASVRHWLSTSLRTHSQKEGSADQEMKTLIITHVTKVMHQEINTELLMYA
jgi:hypothetical protein